MNTERDCCLDALILLHVLDLKIGKLKTCSSRRRSTYPLKTEGNLKFNTFDRKEQLVGWLIGSLKDYLSKELSIRLKAKSIT